MNIGDHDIVLVVDDDMAVRKSLKFALELEGLSIHACGSGDELLDHPDLLNAHCLLLDYKMPSMDGFEVISRLAERNVNIPVILMTSNINRELVRRADAAGVRHLLEKPLLDGALLTAIRHVLHHAE